MDKGINAATSQKYRLMNTVKQQETSGKNLQKVNLMNIGKIKSAQNDPNYETMGQNFSKETIIKCSSDLTLTDKIIQNILDNKAKIPQGRRYKNLENYFVLLGLMGQHYYQMLHETLLFPAYRTVQLYRKKIIDSFDISDNMFNADPQNIKFILQKCLPINFSSKSILAIDSAYVTPYVSIHCNGTVEGLIQKIILCKNQASEIINDENTFSNFICLNQKKTLLMLNLLLC